MRSSAALSPLSGELGLHVCGGRGKHSRLTPGELVALGDRIGFDGDALAKASRLTAKVDSAAVQDGFDLYLHGFIVSDEGRWAVVQQGMNGDRKQARRYHWLSEGMTSFVDEPHIGHRRTEPRQHHQSHRSARRAAHGANRSSCSAALDPTASRARLPRSHLRMRRPVPRPSEDERASASNVAVSCFARASRRPGERRSSAASARQSCRRGRARACRFSRFAAHARCGRAHCPRARIGGGSAARRTLPLQRSRAIFARSRRQGSASVPGSRQSLR